MDDLPGLQTLTQFEQIKLLSDERRLAILCLLMGRAATLSQLAQALESYPAKIRHHLKKLEQAALVELVTTQVVGGFVEKYYRATAAAYAINLAITPTPPAAGAVVALGSHDLALERLAQLLADNAAVPALFTVPVGSLDGLIALRQGVGQLAGAHLPDDDGGAGFNRAYVRRLFPGRAMTLLTLAHRQQGLLVAPGNPKQIEGLADLVRPDLVFVNRQPGTGTRVWLAQQLGRLGLDLAGVKQYGRIARTHHEVAQTIVAGQADVGLGILAAAQMAGLDFIPLFEERYDLVLPTDSIDEPLLQPLFDLMQTAVFRQAVQQLAGYDVTQTGSQQVVRSA
jgi:molybdate-binding protein/DNA-binding HxlR family transcriptional regulator